eukprot:m.165631 g.165631  ORF g.165631 m.165631 type:complete len:122 (-) comp53123_c0_seq3:368-733(-)
MVKWYSTLFLQRNSTILTDSSIDALIYPWALEPPESGNPTQFYGLGVELIFTNPPTTPPTTPDSPVAIYYMGTALDRITTGGFLDSPPSFQPSCSASFVRRIHVFFLFHRDLERNCESVHR